MFIVFFEFLGDFSFRNLSLSVFCGFGENVLKLGSLIGKLW